MSSTSKDLIKFRILKVFSINLYNKNTGKPVLTGNLDENKELKLENLEERKKLIFLSFLYIIYID